MQWLKLYSIPAGAATPDISILFGVWYTDVCVMPRVGELKLVTGKERERAFSE